MSERKPLERGTELVLEDGTKVILDGVVGKGASCIVYNAWRVDRIGEKHKARVKECFPAYCPVTRQGEMVVPSVAEEEEFQKAKERFCQAYKRNVEIRNKCGLTNLTADAYDLCEKNGTWYSIVSCDEGEIYREHEEEYLKEVFERVKAVAVAVKKYHDNGYLHLDIKPENILILQDMKEHVILFDFDSLVELDESGKVKKDAIDGISYSEGFSAPEQGLGKLDRLGKETDIFSIGALVFFKIFGRTAEWGDYSLGTEIGFANMKFQDERYRPGMRMELSRFFRKTLAVSTVARWKDMSELIESLDKLIELSDLEKEYLLYKFKYNEDQCLFVGRQKELEDLERVLEEPDRNMVFVSGIGGIGKTELVRYYAHLNRDKYDSITFLEYTNSLKETICSDDLSINKVEREDGESVEAYFKRKFAVLTKATKRDLIIIDNFDVTPEDSEQDCLLMLEKQCKCKFVFTTREDYSELYKTFSIDSLENEADLMQIFMRNWYKGDEREDYSEEEKEAILELFELVDRHTMTVELLAKHLRCSDWEPSKLLHGMRLTGGITNVRKIHVSHGKDRKAPTKSVVGHLLTLFDMSEFNELEKEVIESLALLGYISIRMQRFFQLLSEKGKEDDENIINAVGNLQRRGWLQVRNRKIFLHAVIHDLVIGEMRPTSKECPRIVNGMIAYMEEELPNETECNIRTRLMQSFMERIEGDDLAYVKLCILYGKEEYLDKAREICKKSEDREAMDLMQKICREEIGHNNLLFFGDDEREEETLFLARIKRVIECTKDAERYALEYSTEASYLGKFYVELGMELLEIADEGGIYWKIVKDGNKLRKQLYQYIIEFYDKGELYIIKSDLSCMEKECLIKEIQKFYIVDELTAFRRGDVFGDAKRAYHYQKMIDKFGDDTSELKNREGSVIKGEECQYYVGGVRKSDFAETEERKGNYKKAIKFYHKAIEERHIRYTWGYRKIAELYGKMGKTREIKKCLELILECNNEEELESGAVVSCYASVCNLLIGLLRRKKKREARKCAEELIRCNREAMQRREDKEYVSWMLVGFFQLYELGTDAREKEKAWQECIRQYEVFGEVEEISEPMLSFFMEYLSRLETDKRRLEYGIELYGRMGDSFGSKKKGIFFEHLLDICSPEKDAGLLYVRVLMLYCECLMEQQLCNYKQIEEYVQYAIKVCDEFEIRDIYIRSLTYRTLGECYLMGRRGTYEQVKELCSKCDYYLIAETEGKGRPDSEKIELWNKAAREYRLVENYIMQEKCLRESIKISIVLLCDSGSDGLYEYFGITYNLFLCYANQKNMEAIKCESRDVLKVVSESFSLCNDIKEIKERVESVTGLWRWNLAGLLKEYGYKDEAIAYCLLPAICSIIKEPTYQKMTEIFRVQIGDIECLVKMLRDTFGSEDIKPEDVDVIAEIYKIIHPLLSNDSRYVDLEQEFIRFLDKHQKGVVEFRRK